MIHRAAAAAILASRQWFKMRGVRQAAILLAFAALGFVMLFPLSVHLSTMTPEPTDPLLNAWRMQWNARAFLTGPAAIADIFNTNIFYPYPLTLAYSEHFIMLSLQALPFLLLAPSHLFGMNLSVVFTFILSGYAMYLLVTALTGSHWAGGLAGLLFAFSPLRFGQINHLELLVTQWMPLTLLTLHYTLTRRSRRYPLLFIIFFNLQALSGFHYALNLTLACALLAAVYALAGRVRWRPGLWTAAGLSVLITLLLNGPIWAVYLRFSRVMGAVRTPGEVRIYSAALTDYLTTIPHNWLYGFTFGRWAAPDHQFQVLMPFGVTGLLLALAALISLTRRRGRKSSYAAPVIFGLLLAGVGLLFSFGIYESALGSGLAPVLGMSPYRWLYENVVLFQGIRVPGRFAVLVLLGLAGLSGLGLAQVLPRARLGPFIAAGLAGLILAEAWSAPLVGPQFPAGRDIPPVYGWVQQHTPANAVVLEWPYQGASEFLYEYYASYHWRPLANGGTGYTPPSYKELRRWLAPFPDARSVDIIQQVGVNVVILHPEMVSAEAWARVQADLPRYWPAIRAIHSVGEAVVLEMAPPACTADPQAVTASLFPAGSNAAVVSLTNAGPAAFVANVRQPSHLVFADGRRRLFTEPMVIPSGATQTETMPLDLPFEAVRKGWLASLNRAVSPGQPSPAPVWPQPDSWLPLNLDFADGSRLAAYQLTPSLPATCGVLAVQLQWAGRGHPGDTVRLQLLDPFGRLAAEHSTQPWQPGAPAIDTHPLPLPGSLPPGRYGLRVWLTAENGTERLPVMAQGVTIPTDQIPPLRVVIHPPAGDFRPQADPPAVFGEGISLVGVDVPAQPVQPGQWLKFSMTWAVEAAPQTDYTVFTQLLGPDGRVWGQYDNLPGGGWYGMPAWLPNRPVTDHYAFQIQPDAPPGDYRLIAGLYQPDTLARLLVATGGDFVELGRVVVKR